MKPTMGRGKGTRQEWDTQALGSAEAEVREGDEGAKSTVGGKHPGRDQGGHRQGGKWGKGGRAEIGRWYQCATCRCENPKLKPIILHN